MAEELLNELDDLNEEENREGVQPLRPQVIATETVSLKMLESRYMTLPAAIPQAMSEWAETPHSS